jgi:CRP-like cAMP-binding protein
MFSGNRVSRQVLESILTNLKVLEDPVSERDEQRIAAAAAACAELSFLRLLEPEELVDTCRQHLRVERLRAGEAVHLQGMEATAAFVVLSGQVSCHARKDLMDIEGGAHMHLLREWKQRELATAKEEAVKAKARYAYISSSANAGSAAEAAAKHEAAVAEQAVEVAAEAVANVMLSGLVPPDKYLMLPDMMGKQRAPAATPTPSAPRKFGLRQQLMRATMDLGLTSDLSPSEVRSKASKLVGVCLTVHNTGDSFGEPTFDSSNRRAITAVCNTACTLLVCPRHVLAATAGAERLKLQLEWLRNVPALAMCSPPTLAQLLQAARRRTFAWSEPVVRAGDKGACLYLVMSGELSLSRATSRPPAPAPHTPAPPVLFSPVPQQIGIRPASPPPTTPAYFLAGAADPAKRAADAAGSPKPAAAGVGDSNTPREMTLRTIGCGQMVPCIVAGAASLGGAVTLAEGVRFPYTARVASAHAELLLLDGRFLSLVLARQDNGRAIGELTALLQSDARRMEQLAQATEDRWLTELVTAKIIIAPAVAPATPTPPSKPSQARTPGASSPRLVSRPATGQRQPPHVLPGPEGPPRVPPPPDPGVIAPSKYSDPSRPGPLPLPPYFEPSTRRDDEDVAAALVPSEVVGEAMGARAADVQALERAMELARLGERARAHALRAPKPPPRATSQGAEALEPPAGRLLPDPEAALVVEVARMEAEALEQAHELQVMFTPRPLRVGVTPKPDFTAITRKHPTGATPSERQRAVTAYLLEANSLHNPLQSEQAVAAANSAAAAAGSRPDCEHRRTVNAAGSRPDSVSLPPRPRQRGARPVSAVPAYRREGGAQLGAYWTGDTRPPSPRAFGAVGAGWATGAARPHFERPHSAQPRVAHRRQGTALSPRQQQQHAQVYLHQPPPPIQLGYGFGYEPRQYPMSFETPHHSPHSPRFSVHIGEDTAAGAHGGANSGGANSDDIHADGVVASTDANLAAAALPPKPSQQPAEAPPPPARRGYANALEAHVRRMRAARGVPEGGGSKALAAEDGYRAPLAVHLLNDDGFLRMQVEESRLHRAGLAGESDEALALAWDHVTVAEMARVLSGSWQPHKRPPLISTSIHAVEAPPVPHHRRQPHARMGAAPSHAVHDAIATARRVGAQADNGPLVLQTAEASSRALPTGDASSAGGVRPPRLAATMAPQPSLYGRPVQVDGPGIATALAGTGLRRAPLA